MKLPSLLAGMTVSYILFQLIGDTIPEEDEESDILWEFVDSLFDLIEPSI